MSDDPKAPPMLNRAGGFAGATGEAQVTPEAAIAAGLRLAGSLADASPLRLAALAAANQAAGRLELRGETARYSLFFKRGVLEHVAAAEGADDLGAFLLGKGLVTAEHLADAEQARSGFGGDLFAALAGLRIIDAARSFPVLQEYGTGLAVCALAIEKGEFLWEPGTPPPPSGFPLVARWALVSDAVRRLDGLTLRRRLAPRMALAPARVGGRVALGDLKLTAQEARLAGLLDGTASLADRVKAAGAEADAMLRVALILGENELLAWGEPRAAAPGPARPAAAPPAAAPTARPPPPGPPRPPPAQPARGAAEAPAPRAPAAKAPAGPPARAAAAAPAPAARTDLASLQAAHEKMADADHFQALGVPRTAGTPQIKAAYFALAKAWHPDSSPADDPPEARKLRADLFARIGEAWGVLGDEARRAQYLEDLKSGATTPVDVSAIFEAENLFQQATAMVKSRQYPAALEELEKAIALNADEPEFHVWRAWVQFLLAADRKKQQSVSAAVIEEALRKLPRCMPAYLFLGQMAKIAGDLALAERHLKRGLAVEPEDVDLVRELRYLRK